MVFKSRSPLALAVALLCFTPGAAWAQPDRLSGRIDATRMVALKGRTNPNARPQDDRGAVDPSFEISYATLHIRSTAAQQSALEVLLVEQQNPASASYHRWLSPEEFGDRFGVSRADVVRIKAWLESEGLTVHDVARGRRWITFSGSAATVGRAFRTSFHHYLTDGEMHFANTAVPSVPEALADVVEEIGGLDDYYPAPIGGDHILKPDYTRSSGTHYLAPDDFATIYDLKPLYASGFDGTGQSLAVVGESAIDIADIRGFRARFNLPPNDPQMVLVGSDPGITWANGEAVLDLEWSGAVARKATIFFVYAKNLNTAIQYAVDQRLAPVISESFIACEPKVTTSQQAIAQQANAEGITWMAGSGDGGAAGCDTQAKLPQASKGYAVATPASIPEVTAVGGTEFDEGSGSYWNTSTNANGASVISYIPEKAWNDSWTRVDLAASTGGASILYSKPWWQTGPGVPDDNARDVPDISMAASSSHDGYLIYKSGMLGSDGGTSVATPVFSGIVAILNQYLVSKGLLSQPGLGNINPALYRLSQTAPAAFHDVVNGDNIVPCMQGTPACVNGSFGYTTGPGYDLVTGLGSVDAYNLVKSWTIGTATNTAVAATPATVTYNGSVKLTATVSAAGGAAMGEVAFMANHVSLGTMALSGSSASLTISAMQLPPGANTITAVYEGSGNLNASAGATTVTVTAPAATCAIVASVSPNPVYQHPPEENGNTWSYSIRLSNESAVAATLTKLTIAGTDYSSSINSWFGTAAIPANGSIATPSLSEKNIKAPLDRVFAFSGTDASGAIWSQQITVSYITRMMMEPSLLLITPTTVSPDPSADASCRWAQQLVVEEQSGFDVDLSTLTSSSTDLSGQLQQIFGTTRLAPFGRLQGTLCWSSATAAAKTTLSLSGTLMQSQSGANVSTSASTTLAAGAGAGVKPSVSPAIVNLPAGSSPKGTISLSFAGGSPQWTARVSPSNSTTSWLTVSPSSGTGNGQLTVTGSAAGLSNGVYNTTILIQSAGASPQFTSVPVVMVVGGSSNIAIGGVTHGASYKTVFAPGMLMSVFGTNLSPAIQHAPSVPLPISMQGVSATVNGYSAPLLDVTPGQINLQIPYEVGAGTAVLGVNNNGQVAYFTFQVQVAAPGIFMTLDGNSNLVPYASGKRGDTLLAFITGEGDVTPPLITGKTPAPSDVTQLPAAVLPVTVTVGGVPATIAFAGIPHGLVGVTQINFTISANAPLGKQPVVVTVGGVASAPVNLTVSQ